MKLLETESVFAFMDVGPIAKGHCLVIPKREYEYLFWAHLNTESVCIDHAATFAELPDEAMVDILPTCKKLAAATVCSVIRLYHNCAIAKR